MNRYAKSIAVLIIMVFGIIFCDARAEDHPQAAIKYDAVLSEPVGKDELDALIKDFDSISVYYENLETGYKYRYLDDKKYFAASVIKAPYVLYIYQLAEDDLADLESTHEYTIDKYWDGTGVIKEMDPGAVFTENELLKYSIRNSDNIAFKMLIAKYGVSGFKDFVTGLGGNAGSIGTVTGASMTAAEAGLYAKSIYKYIESDGIYSAQFKTDLMSTTNRMIVSDFPIARKYGWASEFFHDMAIVYSESPYVLVIMSTRGYGNAEDYGVFRKISLAVQDFNEMNFSTEESDMSDEGSDSEPVE